MTSVNSNVEESSVQLLLLVYLAFGVAAMMTIFFFLDEVKENEMKRTLFFSKLLSTFSLFRDHKMCCLIPLATFYGLQQGFAYGDFTNVRLHFRLILSLIDSKEAYSIKDSGKYHSMVLLLTYLLKFLLLLVVWWEHFPTIGPMAKAHV